MACCSRRHFLAGLASIATFAPAEAFARSRRRTASAERRLWLERGGESIFAAFTLDGKTVDVAGYRQICALMRDRHVSWAEGDRQIAIETVEALWEVQQTLKQVGYHAPIVVHSAYRTPETNARTEGAARHSQHLYGRAVDFHVPGVPIDYLWRVAASRPISGGVGYYPAGWVHLDTGPRRYWAG